jgi:SAM domain (Sterile alpha motif)
MQQIVDWLKKLRMSEYAERFAENRIDFSVLPELTDQDLKDLGVVLGDRRKMLRAIANLDGLETSAPAVPATANTAPPPTLVVSAPIRAVAPPPVSASQTSADKTLPQQASASAI